MKKLFFLLVLALFSFPASTQDELAEGETLQYSMLSDKPNYTWFAAGLTYDLSLNPYNFTLLALGADANIMYEKFYFNFHSRLHLAERFTDYSMNGQSTIESVYKAESSRDIGFNFSYYFKNELKEEEHEVTLKHRGNTKYVMNIPAKRSYRWGADFGFSDGATYYNFGDATLTGVDESGNTAIIESEDENKAVSTYFSQKIIRLGANRSTTVNFSLRADTYGKKYVKDFTRIYVHALVGLGQKLDDVLVPYPNVQNLTLYTRYDLNANAKMNPIGVVIGYEYYVMKKAGIGWIAELGLQPGPRYSFDNNFYLDLKLRFHLGKMLK
jgi:hypothetical protein